MAVARKICVGAMLGITLLLYALDPSRVPLFPACWFRQLTGFYCPGCGSTRAIHHLLHGHFREAVHFNPLVVLLVPVLLTALLWEKVSAWRGRPWSLSQMSPRLAWTLVAVVLLFGMVRNIPLGPFSIAVP